MPFIRYENNFNGSEELPNFFFNAETNTNFQRGRFLGKGGHGSCYELKNLRTKELYAGKIISKEFIEKYSSVENVLRELNIHAQLNNEHIVKYVDAMESPDHFIVVLELCEQGSMADLLNYRKTIPEAEAKLYFHSIISGIKYLHSNNIVHRDIKLGNVLLSGNKIKLCDFGIATLVDRKRRKTLCGTPNYIAPEVLTRQGHRYEVDIWAAGCILFALLMGHPPFNSSSVLSTHELILNHDTQNLPLTDISSNAGNIITQMLQFNPKLRPNAKELLKHPFFL